MCRDHMTFLSATHCQAFLLHLLVEWQRNVPCNAIASVFDVAVARCRQVSLEYGGSDDQPILISNMRCITDTHAVMVTDGRGRIEFTTSQMAAMVGYNVKTLTEGMNITMLMAPPYSQLHTSYLKVMLKYWCWMARPVVTLRLTNSQTTDICLPFGHACCFANMLTTA